VGGGETARDDDLAGLVRRLRACGQQQGRDRGEERDEAALQ